MSDAQLFPGFSTQRIETSGTHIHCVTGGSGPPLLLLHGYPQTHVMWHRVRAGACAELHRRVPGLARLRRFGQAAADDRPRGVLEARDGARHGRDDASARSSISPGRTRPRRPRRASPLPGSSGLRSNEWRCSTSLQRERCLRRTDQAFATAYYHWFFLIQPYDLPERLIGADPAYYLHRKLGGWGTGLQHFDPRALAEYERCFSDPATIHATCEDYRAAASIDLVHDARKRSEQDYMSAARAVG